MARFNCGLELKFAAGTEDGTFSGYGAVFGIEDDGGDLIQKGAFKDSIAAFKSGKAPWPAMLEQHGYFGANGMTPIGVWTDVEEDSTGLKVAGKLALGTQRGKELYELMKMEPRPAISALSIGYRARQFILGTKTGEPRRTLQ